MQLCGDAVSARQRNMDIYADIKHSKTLVHHSFRESVVRYTFSNIYKNLPALGTRNALRSIESLIKSNFRDFLRSALLNTQHTEIMPYM